MNFAKILLPLDLEWPSMAAVHQAAMLARHFHSEIVILHVVRHSSFLGIESGRIEALMEQAHKQEQELRASLAEELDRVPTRRLLVKGDPARAILETAQAEKVDLIVMGLHGRPGFAGKFMGSVTHNILNATEIPIWSVASIEKGTSHLALRSVVCGVDFTAHDNQVVQWAARVCSEFKARLVLAHGTPGVEIYGPGGFYDIPSLKKSLLAAAADRMNKLIKETGVEAEQFIDSGEVYEILNHAARQAGAQLLIIGRRPARGMLGGHAYRIVSHSHLPVLSV